MSSEYAELNHVSMSVESVVVADDDVIGILSDMDEGRDSANGYLRRAAADSA